MCESVFLYWFCRSGSFPCPWRIPQQEGTASLLVHGGSGWQEGGSARRAAELQLSCCLVKRLLLVLEKEPCRAAEVFSHEGRIQPGGEGNLFFFLTEIIASSSGKCGLALCTAGRSGSGLTHVNKMFIQSVKHFGILLS